MHAFPASHQPSRRSPGAVCGALIAAVACGLACTVAAANPASAAPPAAPRPGTAPVPAAPPADVSPVRVAIAFTTPEAGAFAGLYVRGTNGQVYRRDFHIGADAPRGGWVPLTGVVASGPAAAADGGNTGVEVVAARSTAGTLLVRSRSSENSGSWRDLGGALTSAPALASTPEPEPGQTSTTVAAVARGTDGSAWLMLRRFGRWTRWLGLGGVFTSAPSVEVVGDELRVFGRGANGNVYSRRLQLWGTPVTIWQLTGPPTTSAVAPVNITAGTEAYAYRGAGNRLYWYIGNSINLGGNLTSAPDALLVATHSPGTQPDGGDGETPLLMIVARGADNAYWMNTNGTWRSLGGQAR